MEWILFAMVGPLFWTVSNYIDKFAIEKMTKGIADYAFFGTIGPLFVLTIIPIFFGVNATTLWVLVPTMFAGFLLNYTYMTYGITLANTDTSRVIPIYQMRSIVVLLIGALFFGEFLSPMQFIGFFVAMVGVLILGLDFKQVKKPKLNKWTLLAVFSMVSFAFVLLINDFSVENLDIPSVIFYFDLGFLLASGSYLLVPTWRSQIILGLQAATWQKIVLFTINDIADEIAQLCSKIALSLAPAAALVSVAQGIHSFYVLIAGFLLTLWFPHVIKEDITKQKLAQKFLGAFIIFMGIVIVNLL